VYEIAVGKPYNPAVRTWPETPLLRVTPKGVELVLFFNNPTSKEVNEIRNGVPQFAWVDLGQVAFLCFRFGTLSWADCPFHVCRQPADERGMPPGEASDGGHLLTTTVLVNAADGIVRALRAITWPPEFADAVRQTVRRQLDTPPEVAEAAYDRAVDEAYARYPDTDSMLEHAVARA